MSIDYEEQCASSATSSFRHASKPLAKRRDPASCGHARNENEKRMHGNSVNLHFDKGATPLQIKRRYNRDEYTQIHPRIDIQISGQASELRMRLCQPDDDNSTCPDKPYKLNLEMLNRNQTRPQFDLQITLQTGKPSSIMSLSQSYSPRIQLGLDMHDISDVVQTHEAHLDDEVHDSASFCFRVVNMVRDTLMQALSLAHHDGKDGGTEMLIVRLLQTLQHLEMSLDVLKETQIGKCVNKLKKHPNKDIAAHAKHLVRDWKQLIDAYLQSKDNLTLGSIKNSCTGIGYDYDGGMAEHDYEFTKRRRVN